MNYFRYKQFDKDVITVAVGYYLRYALSYRDISEILRERGVTVHHSTVYRWVQEYAPILYQIWKQKHKKAYYKWHVDETYIKIKGKWCYLYRAIDADGHTLDIWLRKQRDNHAAYAFIKRLIKVRKISYQSINTAKNTLKGIECIYALYKKNRRSLQIYGFSPCHEISIMLAS